MIEKVFFPVLLRDNDKGDEDGFNIHIKLGVQFSQDISQITYYSVKDFFSEIGGLFGTLNAISGVVGLVLIALYVVSLGDMLRRKAHYRLHFVQLKKIKALLPDIV